MKTVQFQNVPTVRTYEIKFLCAYVGTYIPQRRSYDKTDAKDLAGARAQIRAEADP